MFYKSIKVRALGTGVQPKGAKGHRVATGHGKSDSVFVHSFLGLGLLASRMSVLEAPGAEACIPLGAEGIIYVLWPSGFYLKIFFFKIKKCEEFSLTLKN